MKTPNEMLSLSRLLTSLAETMKYIRNSGDYDSVELILDMATAQ